MNGARAILLVALLAATAVGCDLLPEPTRTPGRDLADARARWAATAVRSYRFTLAFHCFCMFREPVEITVEDGAVTEVRTSTGDGVPADVRLAWPTTIEAAFGMIERSLEADELRVRYDPFTGIPNLAVVNQDVDMFDEEFSWEISGFAPLP